MLRSATRAYYAESFAPLAQQMREMDVAVLTRADHEAANIRRGLDFALRSGKADLAALFFYGLWLWMLVKERSPKRAATSERTSSSISSQSIRRPGSQSTSESPRYSATMENGRRRSASSAGCSTTFPQ